MDIKGLFVWKVFVWKIGSVIRAIQLISTRKTIFFVPFNHLDHEPLDLEFWKLLGPLGSLVFYLVLVSISFAYTSRNPVSMGLRASASDKNPKPIYVIKRTSSLREWLLQLVTQWLDQLDDQSSFVCVSICCIT